MAISGKQLIANRMNSLKALGKCKGPKDCSNTKYNAFKHGLTALQSVMLLYEDEEEYEMLCENIKNMLPSTDGTEDMLAEKLAFCFWKLRRAAVAEKDIIKSYAKIDSIDWQGLLKSGDLGKVSRYERRIKSYLLKLLKEFIGRLSTKDLSE